MLNQYNNLLLQLLEQYSSVWHHSRVRRYLTSEDYPSAEAKGKPWFGLLMLLKKYPEHFVIHTRSKGRVTSEFVSLVSLISWAYLCTSGKYSKILDKQPLCMC